MQLNHYLIVVAASLLISCGGPKVISTQSAPGTDLSKFKTFDFYKLEASGDTIPGKFKERSAMIQDEVSSQLNSRGFTRSSDKPDLFINIGLVVKAEVQTRETDIREAPRYMGQRNYHWESEEIVVDNYRVGTATVEMVNPSTNTLVWKSVVEDVIPDKDEKVAATIKEGIQQMFSKFPK